MNHLARILSLLILVSAAVFFTNCGGGDDPTKSEEEEQLDKLKAGQWTIVTVTGPGGDKTADYNGMTLTVSGTFAAGGVYNYTSTANPWPALTAWKKEDTWKFKPGAEATTLIRLSDDEEMTYSLSNSDKQLSISFNYIGSGFPNGGRVASVDGDWTFVFERP
jgi:hypothetical protein